MTRSHVDKLLTGYGQFKQDYFEDNRKTFRDLARKGQSPKIMIISCCDSRVAPEMFLNADPGELFIMRNVANIVPPYAPDKELHGTSSAIEYAVKELKVQDIIVLGHAQCGGIAAMMDGHMKCDHKHEFIPQWVSIAERALEKVRAESPDLNGPDLERAVERAGILHGMSNLLTYPFVRERVIGDGLHLHGWYFDIEDAKLLIYRSRDKGFVPADSLD